MNRQLLFEFEDEYTEDDLQRDIKKTQILPFTQIGTPSPYRPPAKSRVQASMKSSGPVDVSFAVKPVFQVKPMQFKSQAPSGSQNEVPTGLKTPSNGSNAWARPKPTTSLPAPQLAATQPSTQDLNSTFDSYVPSQSHSIQEQAEEPKRQVSAQKSSVKVVPSRYMQQLAKIESTAKSAKKSAKNPTRNPLSTIDANGTSSSDLRRATIASSKKPAAKPVSATGRTSVGHSVSQMAKHGRTASISAIPDSDAVGASVTRASSDIGFSTSNSVKTANAMEANATGGTTAQPPKNTSQGSVALSSSQSDLRAALLQRREQKAAAAAAAKQAASAKARPSMGPPAGRPSLRSSAANVSTTANGEYGATNKTPGRALLVRQQSANLELSARKQALVSLESNSKVVPSRYMNAKVVPMVGEDIETNGASDETSSNGSAAPTPTRTPRGLQRSLSTSSIKKSSATTAKKGAVAAPTIAASKTTQQIANMSARIAQTISRDPSSSSLVSSSSLQSVNGAPKAPTLASVQLEAQILQSQLLQWHFVNHRLEQARAAKRATSTHMITAVLKKLEEMRKESDEVELALSALQAKVYGAELEQFKVSCTKPIANEIKSFLDKYEDTAVHLARDTHKMPTLGVAPTDLNSLLYSMQDSQAILDKIQREFGQEFSDWENTGNAIQSLASAVRTETLEIKSYSEMLHALSSMGNHQASLIIHKLHLQDAANTSSSISMP